MCRFAVYHGDEAILMRDLLETPQNSLIAQSKSAREGKHGVNADGVGIAWYNEELTPEPGVYRSTRPAWGDSNLRHIARMVASRSFCAHVRASTVGDVSLSNCHPFSYDQYAFVHNGTVRNFKNIKRALTDEIEDRFFTEIGGQTDSEHVFYLLMHFLHQDEKRDLVAAVQKTFSWIVAQQSLLSENDFSRLNICLTKGNETIVTKFTTKGESQLSLHYAKKSYTVPVLNPDSDEEKSIKAMNASIIASEPLTDYAPEWLEVPENHYILLRDGHDMEIKPIDLSLEFARDYR